MRGENPVVLGEYPTIFTKRGRTMKTRQDPATKPYFRCLSCPRFRNVCGGMPTRGMDLQDWCEYMRDVKEIAHLTNAYIAQESDVSIKTIERIMAINIEQDIMRATARRIELVVIGAVGKHICELDYEDSTATDRINKLLEQVEFLRKDNERKSRIIDKFLGA